MLVPSQAIRRGMTRRVVLLVSAGIALGALILFVVTNLEPAPVSPEPLARPEVTELVELPPLQEGDIASQGVAFDDATFDLPSGGWIQITDSDGNLAQQYRFRRLDPDPPGQGPGWIAMTEPELDVFLDDGQVVHLTGDRALAYAPNRLVESGTLTGQVRISLASSAAPDATTTLLVRTPLARFDNILGEVLCPETIRVETLGGAFDGRELKLLYNDQSDVIELLQVTHVERIRLAAQETTDGESRDTAPDAPVDPALVPNASDAVPPDKTVPLAPAPRTKTPGPAPATVAVADDRPFLLTLSDDVRIVQGPRSAHGDVLTALFTLDSRPLQGDGTTAHRDRGITTPASRARLVAFRQAVEDGIAPAPDPMDTIITCRGPMTLVPAPADSPPLASRRDVQLELVGRPVQLIDAEASLNARGATLVYLGDDDRLELRGDEPFPLEVRSADFDADAETLWFVRRSGRGGLAGPGTARVRSDATQPEAADGNPDALDLVWQRALDLEFARDNGEPDLSRVRKILVRGAVRALSTSLAARDTATPGTQGELRAETVVIDVAPSRSSPGDRGLEPRRLEARGAVHVADTDQVLDADHLVATFVTNEDGQTEVETVDARGHVVLVKADGLRVEAARVEGNALRRTARLTGNAGEGVRIVDGLQTIDEAAVVTIDDTAGRYSVEGGGHFRRLRAEDTAMVELDLRWQESVVVAPLPEDATRRRALFTGDVVVSSPELVLEHADELALVFLVATDDVEAIDARGGVVMRSAGDPGRLHAEQMDITLETTPDGEVSPTLVRAAGQVTVTDEDSTLWCERLAVTFGRTSTAGDAFAQARARAETVEADGDVQVRLSDGTRVWADRLEGDARRDVAELFGGRIIVVASAFALDRGTHLILDERANVHRIAGAGVLLGYHDPLPLPPPDARGAPPVFPALRAMEAMWTREAVYRVTGTGGILDLDGDVRAASWPDGRQSNTIDATHLELTFLDGPDAGESADPGSTLSTMLARGSARLESRAWQDDTKTGPPRVSYLAAEEVRYDQLTGDAFVPGGGELLLRDGEGPGGFGSAGTTLMRWTRSMAMTAMDSTRSRIVLDGQVEAVHRRSSGETSTLTGERLEAVVARATGGPSGAIDLGEAMQLERLAGWGAIYVRTPERDVTCDEFDYDVATGRADVRAGPGRTVSVLDRGSAIPSHHRRIEWNMIDDTITLYDGAAGGAP